MKKSYRLTTLSILYLFFLLLSSCAKDDNITINPAPPSDKPEVSFVTPTENSELIDSIKVEIKAIDNKGITKVEFVVNNNVYRSWDLPPYSFTWYLNTYVDSTPVAIYAKAYDADSNFTTTKIYYFTLRQLFAPSNLIMSNFDSNTIRLNWNDLSKIETGFVIEQSIDSSYFSSIAQVSENAKTYNVTGLNPNNDYTFRVKAIRNNLSSAYSNHVNLLNYLYAPTNLNMVELTGTSVNLSWTDNTSFETGYSIEQSFGMGDFTEIKKLDINATSFSVVGLDTSNGYKYRVKAVRNYLSSFYSNTININYETVVEVKTISAHSNPVSAVSFNHDGNVIASGSWDKTIKLWDVNSWSLIRTLNGHTSYIWSVPFNYDGNWLASCSDDRTVKIWDVDNGNNIQTFNRHSSWVRSVAFRPADNLIASGSDDDTIRIWHINSGILVNTLTDHTSGVNSVAFSPDGSIIASGSNDGTIKLWHLGTGTLIRTLIGHASSVWAVAFSINGNIIASGSNDNTIKLWEVSTGALLYTFLGHTQLVRSLSFSKDGNILASGSYDNTIKMWDINNKSLIRTLNGHTAVVFSVSFSPSANQLVSGSYDQKIKLWSFTNHWIKK